MERLVVSVASLTCFFLCGGFAVAQDFSSEPRYLAFYQARVNTKYELQSESVIALWWIIERFGDKSTMLAEMRVLLERHSMLFPNCKHAEQVASYREVVARMLTETRPINESKIEQLIFDIRDLNMHQFHRPSQGLRFVGPGSLRFGEHDAAKQLKDIGYDAIPSLIDHIDDDTLTRTPSISYWRHSDFSHRVLTVGECCGKIMEAILPTARQFDFSGDPKTAKQAMRQHYRHLVAQKRAEQ